jgi:hypothetical protein
LRARALLLTIAALLGTSLGACAGDGDDQARGETTRTATTTQPAPPPVGEPADALQDFLRAIEAGDERISWGLVSLETKTIFQISREQFIKAYMPALKAELDPGGKVVLSQRFGADRAVVALEEGAKKLPFAAALKGEEGVWRVELFYPELTLMSPTPGERVAAGRQKVSVDVVRRRDRTMDVRMWFDGKPVEPTLETTGHFLNTYVATVPVKRRKHLLVAYATTEDGQSGAGAWEFTGR